MFQVEDDLEGIRTVDNQPELMSRFKNFGRNLMDLNDKAARRQTVSLNLIPAETRNFVLISIAKHVENFRALTNLLNTSQDVNLLISVV